MTDPRDQRMTPPVPRDHDDASLSELMPFRSRKISLLKSPVFLFMVASGLASVAMFGMFSQVLANQNQQGFQVFLTFVNVTIFVMLLMIQVGVYAYSRTTRSIWVFAIAYAITVAQMITPIINPYFFIFRSVLPGGLEVTQNTSFIAAFISMFFGAGLMEELLKAVPMLIGAWLAWSLMKTPQKANTPIYKWLHIRGPLDGVVMGVFTGAAFIMIETAMQYVPRTALAIANEADYGSGIAAGMLLLIPRVMGGAVGHIAYSVIFGYFIGLAVIRPRQRWKLIAIGWGVSSLIHGLWNSVGQINSNLNYAVALISAIMAGAALLKARQIEAAESGGDRFTSGSIVVDRSPQQPPPVHRAAPTPAPAAPPPAAPSIETSLVLDVDGLIVPLRAGGRIDLGAEPALGGRGRGVSGEIVPHPTRANVLGLQNTGEAGWTAHLRNGSQQAIQRHQNVRLAAGVTVDFGGGLVGRVRAAG